MDHPSSNVPRWTQKLSPASSPVQEPAINAGVVDFEKQSIASAEEDSHLVSLPLEKNGSDYPPDNVPRWTPKASPARSPVKQPLTSAGVGDFETQSVASEDDVSFANSLPRQEEGTDYSPDHNVPRWTPKGSPASFRRHSRSFSSTKFPYSIAGFAPGAPHLDVHNASSLRFGSQVANSFGIEQENHVTGNNVASVTTNKDGVFLTWKDLWVTVPDGKKGRRSILQGLTGYAEPGSVVAIMGPSGCGKSTLLDSLAGRLSSNTQQAGEILINGRKERLAFGTSAYVTQDDTLMTTLTVREAVYYSAQLQLPDSMSSSEKKERAETTIREMGLQDSMNTRIGGWNVKGLSGGQKRRVSICIEILTRPKLLFLDEPTSGLDSAASFHVMSRIVKIAHQDGRTVIASIHQPSSEVFELFDNLCLLSTGRTVYFGAISMAEKFFASNGFPCPTLRNPSDHYLRTVNKDFDADIEQGSNGTMSTEEVIGMLVKSYESSGTFQEVQQSVSKIRQQKGGALEKGSHASFITQCLVLTKRSFVNMYRDLGYYWLRLAIYIALCLCVGTIFYDIGFSYGSIQARGSMLMFVAAFLTFMAIGGFPSFVEDMKVFGRERLNGHYGVGAYVFGKFFSSIPYLLLISVVPGAIAYYLVGLQRSFEHFAYFVSVLFVCMMLVESLMMIVASIVPDFLMGIITGAGIQGVMMLNGGFFKNEFEGLTFPNEQAGGPPTITGDEILRNIWQVEMGYSKWIDLAILFGMVILYRLMFWAIIKSAEKVKPIIKALASGSPKHSERIVDEPTSTAS
ncbi:ABC transporter G family member 11 [Morella rubra]|uniref:ABC transporter G family member 11 n=1 Tax=Morella rubra TaxID=262757 RepID=A0A6A1WL89_9ROSI|nr:ABC transporter G family member 11 [Morella rubra]